MADVDVTQLRITNLIPQRPPFVMVDRLVYCDMNDAVTEMRILSDNLFCEEGLLSQTGMIENMAQSCAARMGWVCMTRHEGVKIGVIGEIRDCMFIRQPKENELLTTEVHIVEDVFNLTLAQVTMKVGEEVLASTHIKIALVDNVKQQVL